MRKPEAKEHDLKDLLQNQKYCIDDYQREYKWGERQIKELIFDLTEKFLEDYVDGAELKDIKNYGTYFLGSILISDKNGSNYIVDGQQRLTSLTLLLIYIHNILKEQDRLNDVALLPSLIFSQSIDGNSYNIDVPERNRCMDALFNDREEDINISNENESSINLINRYRNIKEIFPEEIKEKLLNFTWWLISHVFIVKITTYSDNEAYTIFETMNDRGLSLDSIEMLKGYLLANIDENKRKLANDLWKKRHQELNELGKEEAADFFKNWLRAKYAESYRKKNSAGSGYIQRDFEKIGNAFHKWVRDKRKELELNKSSDYENFIMKEFSFYSSLYLRIRNYEQELTSGYEEVYYNSHNNFTLQIMMIFSSIRSNDSEEIIDKKIKLVSTFIDIFIARNLVNSRALGYSSVMYRVFNFVKEIRDKELYEAHSILFKILDELYEEFDALDYYRLNKQNRKKVHYLLARLTAYIEEESGLGANFEKYVNKGEHKPFEIEHIIPDKYSRYSEIFESEDEFETVRNRLGNLILLQRGTNQSLNDDIYKKKIVRYASENILAQTLSENCYKNNPNFIRFKDKNNINFKAYSNFEKVEILERNQLYKDLFENIWNLDKLAKYL